MTPESDPRAEFTDALDEFFTLALGWGVQGREAKPVVEARARVVGIYKRVRIDLEAAQADADIFRDALAQIAGMREDQFSLLTVLPVIANAIESVSLTRRSK